VRILGIHDGHNATACLYDSGRILAIVSEERFSRRKNQSGFPTLAVRWLVDEYGLDAKNLDVVAAAGLLTPMQEFGKQIGPWYRVASAISKVAPSRLMRAPGLTKAYQAVRRMGTPRVSQLAQHLAPYGVSASKIRLVEHHTCHAHAAYWLDYRRRPEPTLVVTLDNTGDGMCGSVSVAEASGDFRRLRSFPSLQSIGMMYTAVTRYLGMKPVEDEHKVMGLAPYARGAQAERVYELLRGHMDLSSDGLDIVNHTGLWEDAYVERFQRELAGFRFDHIAGGVQRLLETVVPGLLRAWSRKTGIRKLAVGGGIFMNVKLNMLVNQLDDFDEVYFLPSCGDESNAAGAALASAWQLHQSAGKEFEPEPLANLYLGPAFTNDAVASALATYEGQLRWRRSDDVERETASLLAQDLVVGRMSGRMEFGARALGNRSILARGASLNNVRKINAAIKMRDFWMPFAASMLAERSGDYIDNPTQTPAPYMVLAFPSTPLAASELIAGLHPFDLSCRPQVVEREWNPKFHRLLKCYEELTGVGAVLNTSFNLHGDPLVCAPAEAIETYRQSSLDVLTIEDYVIWDPKRLQLPMADGSTQ
jgi:carbamoyltransferase